MIRTMDAVVLRAFPLGENDRIVIAYAADQGKVKGVAKGARKRGQRWGAAFEPLSQVRLSLYARPGAELGRVTGCELLRSHVRMQSDPVHAAICAYLAELTLELTVEHDPQPALYRLLLHALEALERGSEPTLVARYVELWMLRISGHLPDLTRCPVCLERAPGRLRGAELLCRTCAAPKLSTDLEIPAAVLSAGQKLLTNRIERLGPLPAADLAQLGRLAAWLIETVVEKPLKTPAVVARLLRSR
ncbi:MAG TPA: DNA repair protein RecO [Acidobacteriota bacterium]